MSSLFESAVSFLMMVVSLMNKVTIAFHIFAIRFYTQKENGEILAMRASRTVDIARSKIK